MVASACALVSELTMMTGAGRELHDFGESDAKHAQHFNIHGDDIRHELDSFLNASTPSLAVSTT